MKYYKILNQEEKHNDMQYQTGLNVDILPFSPSGDCEPGGIYFASKDILAFLSHGVWIREVTLPEGEEVYEENSYCQKFKAHRVILGERRKIDLDVIKSLVEQGANIHAANDSAMRYALAYGVMYIVKYLVEQNAYTYIEIGKFVRYASEYGHLEVVKYLVEQGANIHADNDAALCGASIYGYIDTVKYLVEQGANIHTISDCAIRYASMYGHLEVVKYLVEQGADIHADNDAVLCDASMHGHLDIVKYLVEQGADIHDSTIECVEERGYTKIAKYLEEMKKK